MVEKDKGISGFPFQDKCCIIIKIEKSVAMR